MEKQKILPQFNDLTDLYRFYKTTNLARWANLQLCKICVQNPNLTCKIIKLGQNLCGSTKNIIFNVVALAISSLLPAHIEAKTSKSTQLCCKISVTVGSVIGEVYSSFTIAYWESGCYMKLDEFLRGCILSRYGR